MKNLKVNVGKMLSLRGTALVLALASMVSLTGCGKKADCDVNDLHAHMYVSEDGFTRYINNEHLKYEGYDRYDDYILSDDKDLLKFEDKKDLLKIEDNLDKVNEIEAGLHDYIEYRYAYTTLLPIPIRIGKSTIYTFVPVTHYSWTRDENHSRLTGEERLCHYVCTAYKVETDEHGKKVLIPSPQVDDIKEVMGEYPYMKKTFYKAVDVKYGTDLDYEDGPAEEDKHYDPAKDVPIEETSQQTTEKAKVKSLTNKRV